MASTTNILGKNFFNISKDIYDKQKFRKNNDKVIVELNEFNNDKTINKTSITDMINKMENYIIPPELNFVEFDDIQPFVMYIFEFKHLLDKQDLTDIWQGLMPKISLTAEKDEVKLSHNISPWEFYEGKKLPPNIRWMVFKVKKKASINYFEKTADTKDDTRFKFDFKIGSKKPEYSYNWPYDHFSLVELAQVEASIKIKGK